MRYLSHFFVSSVSALYQKGGPVKLLNASEFEKEVVSSDGPALVEFFASWCGHCKQLVPEFEKTAKALLGVVKVVAVEDQAVMGKYQVQGFPTIKWFGDDKSKPEEYNSSRDAKGMTSFATQKVKEIVNKRMGISNSSNSSKSSGSSGGGDTVVLTDGDFDEKVLQDETNAWFVKFYAPWCGHCKAIAGVWDELATSMKGKVKIGKMDATVERNVPGRYGVQGFPAIKMFPAGKNTAPVDYEGGRDLNSFRTFANKYFKTESKQLLTQEQFDKDCADKLCLIAFLPNLYDENGSAKERKGMLAKYNEAGGAATVGVELMWSQGGDQFELEEKLSLQFGWPALIAVSMKKKVFMTYKGTWEADKIKSWINGLGVAKRHLMKLPDTLPPVAKQKKWDGKDAPKLDEEL